MRSGDGVLDALRCTDRPAPREEMVGAIDRAVEELLQAAGIETPPVDAIALAQRHLGMIICLDRRQPQRGRAQRAGGRQADLFAPGADGGTPSVDGGPRNRRTPQSFLPEAAGRRAGTNAADDGRIVGQPFRLSPAGSWLLVRRRCTRGGLRSAGPRAALPPGPP